MPVIPLLLRHIPGLQVYQHGVWTFANPEIRHGQSHVRNIRDAGYQTGVVGKTHLWVHGKGHARDHLQEMCDWGFADARETLFFDVKWANLPQLIEQVYSRNLQDQSFFWFGRPRLAQQFYELDTSLDLKINVSKPEHVERAKQDFGAHIVEFGLHDPVHEIVAACREQNVNSMILQSGNDRTRFIEVLESGADMINLDYADEFINIQKAWLVKPDLDRFPR
jgi:hypothetical protein